MTDSAGVQCGNESCAPTDRSIAAGGWLLNLEPSLDAEFRDVVECLTTLK